MGCKSDMRLTTGSRWKSAVCNTEVMLVKPPRDAVQLECGGVAMLPHNAEQMEGLAPASGREGGTLLGKRYGDDDQGLEVLCTKPGKGALSLDGQALAMREAKPLPSSD